MKKTILFLITTLFLIAPVASFADDWGWVNRMETKKQARERHSAERYQYQQRHGTPLGGYHEPLGDTAPRGTLSPGYRDRDDTGRPSLGPSLYR
ncbi:MAG: hypothetical protein JRJ86_14665 [Deltaproteobacteria bacterium]|nr:hypothetical protein [Deltaproteobacteria bacterium]MBW1795509.1 hypothetical protein [Deltaproteobacteria bacterium]